MIGAVAGDIIGSIYEHSNIKTKDFPLFDERCRYTDDTVCTIAVAECLLNKGNFTEYLKSYVLKYPNRGYGGMFERWAKDPNAGPYNSWGNGAAMRVSATPYFSKDEGEVLALAKEQAEVSHNHPDAIKGARAVALVMWMALNGAKQSAIRNKIEEGFNYDLRRTVDEIRPTHGFDVSCKGTVQTAIICSLEALDYEDAIRNSISLGGDSDTLACITGGIAETLFGVPIQIIVETRKYLTNGIIDVLDEFVKTQSGGFS